MSEKQARHIAELEQQLLTAYAQKHELATQLATAQREIAALCQLDHLEATLGAMSVSELDSARARVDSDLVPALARMPALMLISEDGSLYNVVSWALGPVEPLGALELLLQRVEGKTPMQLRQEAEQRAERAEAALVALRARLRAETESEWEQHEEETHG